MQNYYAQQLEIFQPNSIVKVQFSGECGKTNWMNLNLDSIAAIRRFLDVLESEELAATE